MTLAQSVPHSLWESAQGAIIAMPTSHYLLKFLLVVLGENAINQNQDLFLALSSSLFFVHSVIWRFIIRRTNEKYGLRLDPVNMIRYAQTWIQKRRSQAGNNMPAHT